MNQFLGREMSITSRSIEELHDYLNNGYRRLVMAHPGVAHQSSDNICSWQGTFLFCKQNKILDKYIISSYKKLLNRVGEKTLRLIKQLTCWWDDIAWVSNHHCKWEKQKEKHRDYDKPNGSLGIWWDWRTLLFRMTSSNIFIHLDPAWTKAGESLMKRFNASNSYQLVGRLLEAHQNLH